MRSKECQSSPRAEVPRGEVMRTPDDVAAMLQLKALGWGIKRIARELRCSPIGTAPQFAGNPLDAPSQCLQLQHRRHVIRRSHYLSPWDLRPGRTLAFL